MSDNNEFDQNWPQAWEEHWKPLLSTDSNLDEQKVEKQMHDLVFTAEQASMVYRVLTGNQLEEPMAYADEIIPLFRQQLQDGYDHGYETGRSEAQVESRDPRINPLPGDELSTATYKVKVVSISVNETGTQKVYYKTTPPNTNYGEYANNATLMSWQYLMANLEIQVLKLAGQDA